MPDDEKYNTFSYFGIHLFFFFFTLFVWAVNDKQFKMIVRKKSKLAVRQVSKCLYTRLSLTVWLHANYATLSRSVSVCLQLKTSCLWSSDKLLCSYQCADAADLISKLLLISHTHFALRSIVLLLLFALWSLRWWCFMWEYIISDAFSGKTKTRSM